MATVKKEEEIPTAPAPVQTPVETAQAVTENVSMAATPTPAAAPVNPAPVSETPASSAPSTPAQVPAAPVTGTPASPKPTDYKWNPATQKYEEQGKTPALETPAPVVTPPTATPAKAETVDFDVSTGREQEIQSNLSKITADNAALLGDRAKFDQAFGYSTADAGKKALLDSFFDSKQVKPDADSFFKSLSSGAQVPAQFRNTPEFASAKKRFETFNAFRGYDYGKFSTALSTGKILKGSTLYNDLMADPNASAQLKKAETLNGINGSTPAEDKIRETVMGEIKATTFWSAVEDGSISPEEADALLSNAEIKAKQKEIEPLKKEYDRLKAEYDAIDDEVKNEYGGKGVSGSYIAAKAGERKKNIYKQLQVATDSYNTAVGTLAELKKSQADVLSLNMKLYEDRQATERQKELARFQSDLSLSTEQKKFEQQVAQKAAAASDPVLATQDILDTYAKLGILPQRSSAEIVADIQAQVKAGKPLGQALSELNTAFQSKDEYKNYLATKFKKEEAPSDWKLQNVTMNGETKTVRYNEKTGEMREISAPSTGVLGTPGASESAPTADALEHIRKWEWFRDAAYQDSAGKWTIGYGFTNVDGKPVKQGDTMTRQRADELFADKVSQYTNYRNLIKVPLNPTQEAALNSFEYNLGRNIWDKSAKPIIDKINAGDFAGASEYMKKFTYAGGKQVRGLVNRRNEEAKMLATETPQFAQQFLGALQRGEFVTDGKWASNGKREYTTVEQATMDSYLKNPEGKTQSEKMKKMWLTDADANAYVSGKGELEKLPTEARVEIGKAKTAFKTNEQVKAFENTLSASRDLISSLNSELKWPGDVAAIFQFMKTLDPASVVRESEFELAASTAGYAGNTKKFLENLSNPNDKSWLVPETREAFRKLAMKYVENKAKTYDRMYDDMRNESKAWGAPDVLIPTRASDELRMSKPKTEYSKYF